MEKMKNLNYCTVAPSCTPVTPGSPRRRDGGRRRRGTLGGQVSGSRSRFTADQLDLGYVTLSTTT
jgi:hypothetical protein